MRPAAQEGTTQAERSKTAREAPARATALRAQDLWAAIDMLADRHGMTASGLARRAGLDATTFNKSKRVIDGRARWPSTQSIAAILETLAMSFGDFAALADSAARSRVAAPQKGRPVRSGGAARNRLERAPGRSTQRPL